MKRLLGLLIGLVLTLGVTALGDKPPATGFKYYVANNGSDANAGTSPSSPWKTLAKVNASMGIIAAGDSILLNRGDVFYGSIIFTKSGTSTARIVVSSYGTGNQPVISGFSTVSGWTLTTTGVYQAPLVSKKWLKMVTMNGVPQEIGRYPNSDAANGGYLTYESFTGNTAIADSQLTNTPNWTGSELVIRKAEWIIEDNIITSHSGVNISYRTNRPISIVNTSSYTAVKNFGYYIQNDIKTLDKFGEWFYDTVGNKLNVYFGTAPTSGYIVKASTVDTLINMVGFSYITIKDIALDGGNSTAIWNYGGSFIDVVGCTISNCGGKGTIFTNTSDVNISNNIAHDCLSTGISVANGSVSNPKNNVTTNDNTVYAIAKFIGMAQHYDGGDAKGMSVSAASNLNVYRNTVHDIGFMGIQFQGSNVVVANNNVYDYDKKMQDGGGIYHYSGNSAGTSNLVPSSIKTNRLVKDNIVHDANGNIDGTTLSNAEADGMYADGISWNTRYEGNTIYNVTGKAFTANSPAYTSIRNNVIRNAKVAIGWNRAWYASHVDNDTIVGNQIFMDKPWQVAFQYQNTGIGTLPLDSALFKLGKIDSNYYNGISATPFTFLIYASAGGAVVNYSPLNLTDWSSFSHYDAHSNVIKDFPTYTVASYLTGNLASGGGTFASSVSGYSVFGTATTMTWDNTSKITGTGSLRLDFSANKQLYFPIVHSPIGAVTAGDKILVRLKVKSTNRGANGKIYLRKTASTYYSISDTAYYTFNSTTSTKEVLLTVNSTEAGGSIVINTDQISGTTYYDDIEVYKITPNILNTTDSTKLITNATAVSASQVLPYKYTDVKSGTFYNGTANLAPFDGALVQYVSAITGGGPSSFPVTATFTNPLCNNDITAVTIGATGGTAPYTGAGIIYLSPGIYTNYLVKDAAGDSGVVSFTIPNPTKVFAYATMSSINSGGTAQVTITGVGGTGVYTGTGVFTQGPGTVRYTIYDANMCSAYIDVTVAYPAATLSFIAPTSKVAEGVGFTLTATGTNFRAASQLKWNGSVRATTYIDSVTISAVIPGTDLPLTSGGSTASVTVYNTDDLTTTNAQVFSMLVDTPKITLLTPSTIAANGVQFTLTVDGTSFISGRSVVKWKGASVPTTFVSPTRLTAVISSTLNGTGFGGTSAAVTVINSGNVTPSNTSNVTQTVYTSTTTTRKVKWRVRN